MDKKSQENKYYIIIPMVIFTFFLVVNCVTPLMGEDYALMAASRQELMTAGFAHKILLMISRIYQQMTMWNIRIGEQISILFGCFDKMAFNICNSICTMYYLYLVYIFAFKRRWKMNKRNIVYLVVAVTVILTMQPALGEIFFWKTGSTNYLWAICLLLTAALPLRFYIGYDTVDLVGNSKGKLFLITSLSFFAGFTNENTVIYVILLYMGTIIFYIKKKKLPVWIYTSVTALLAGFICMYTAPSTRNRVAVYSQMMGIDSVGLKDYMIRAGNVIVCFFTSNDIIFITTLLVLLVYLFLTITDKNVEKEEKINCLVKNDENFLLLLLTIVSCGALIFSPYVEIRSFLITDFFMLVCILYYLEKILDRMQKYEWLFTNALLCILLAAGIVEGGKIYITYHAYDRFVTLREDAVELYQKDTPFFWGQYQADNTSRILTTREDWLMGNRDTLVDYYGKDILCWNNYIYKLDQTGYKTRDSIGKIDQVMYDKNSDTIWLEGWAALMQADAEESNIYIYLDTGRERYYFSTEKLERMDVVEALDGAKRYKESGFRGGINVLHEWFDGTCDDTAVTLGLCILNEKQQIMADRIAEEKVNIAK